MNRFAKTAAPFVLALAAFTALRAEEAKPAGPAEKVKSTAEVVESMKDDHKKGGFLGEPQIDVAETSQRDFKGFVAWHNPYSGQAACRVYIYVHDPVGKVWNRKVAAEFEETADVSVEFGPHRIWIRDDAGKIIHRYPAE